eukprot:TRINITY_DN1488_c0_g1_i1.p1 TRINITY_DN1488_c0_g1~~TRINITY_DN1488_c0_g1_i1.p1  ORF type:complete len:331 (+),score=50.77 TRINITY_DN1488_c0_g1_i1:42-995(+)
MKLPLKGHVQIKDPLAKGDVIYDIPLTKIYETAGLRGKGHRSCLCRLYLEGRCGQGRKCKSFHVDRTYISELRAAMGVEIEHNFITEVVVFEEDQSGITTFAVRFPAVMKTKGLDDYRQAHSNNEIIPKRLCDATRCKYGELCDNIHVKELELKALNTKRLRTPCCQHHGDRHHLSLAASIKHAHSNELVIIPAHFLALTECLKRISRGQILTIRDICIPHINGRCKYGKSCGHLHVCRVWWNNKNNGETEAVSVEQRPIMPSVNKSNIRFTSDDEFDRIDEVVDESFGLPVWDQNCPPHLGRMCSADFCSLQPVPF